MVIELIACSAGVVEAAVEVGVEVVVVVEVAFDLPPLLVRPVILRINGLERFAV
ncbi:hypothetical protein [Solimicrobium silvestre]|uniref:hypothetical protein n=1 Tax=Solimicrobium silvestre TaxID=2099400 RepID=UPI0013FD59A1|nr:hypothetical protein [Solimicrobium silvestre]